MQSIQSFPQNIEEADKIYASFLENGRQSFENGFEIILTVAQFFYEAGRIADSVAAAEEALVLLGANGDSKLKFKALLLKNKANAGLGNFYKVKKDLPILLSLDGSNSEVIELQKECKFRLRKSYGGSFYFLGISCLVLYITMRFALLTDVLALLICGLILVALGFLFNLAKREK